MRDTTKNDYTRAVKGRHEGLIWTTSINPTNWGRAAHLPAAQNTTSWGRAAYQSPLTARQHRASWRPLPSAPGPTTHARCPLNWGQGSPNRSAESRFAARPSDGLLGSTLPETHEFTHTPHRRQHTATPAPGSAVVCHPWHNAVSFFLPSSIHAAAKSPSMAHPAGPFRRPLAAGLPWPAGPLRGHRPGASRSKQRITTYPF